MKDKSTDPRIHCDYSKLIKLQSQARAFSLLPNLKSGTALSGRHSSIFRGRGLNFEELRHYQLGDDIRNLDWKVTMRTGKPHVRSYTEEKDRHFIICVDQRSSMYFSSVDTMKSVVAAELAALTAWRILQDSDRVGFVLQSTEKLHWLTAKRSQGDLLHRLKLLANTNHSLDVMSKDSDAVSFSQFVTLLGRLKLKETTIIILSDWHGTTPDDITHLKHLQKHNDVLGVLISDPFESHLPALHNDWVVGDGSLQISINEEKKFDLANKGLSEQQSLKREQLIQLMAAKGLPVIETDTSGAHIEQFKRAVGGRR
ncbi:DUF58 domain-containing protein [Aliivibrio finisterrensis]|uniref:DUF58 domain-containing protein n=1 Tax=Aliivibrio finisterrensis TaxID=511998 RepID=UPI00101F7126|nr:DUF58 domain-containing protein [Aliivibrio finisterrensis]RYU68775.1 DUF58 domain-containing protein [Aliivibrio finisterrensis]RYU72691.1 DUF58 domain-containing protein [Aliivibrio finisterrensis]RYU72819.1 DUF58 domain-containing protein [Aliivibrio finisterrensis]